MTSAFNGGSSPSRVQKSGSAVRSVGMLPTVSGRQWLVVGTILGFTGTVISLCICMVMLVGVRHFPSTLGKALDSSEGSADTGNIAVEGRHTDNAAPLPGPSGFSTDYGYHRVVRSRWPEMYGKVPEKTIWSYWYNKEHCPTADNCILPPIVELCTETVAKNKGTFNYKILHRDEVEKYVTRMELPLHFDDMKPAHQKDALMNALLARYGGVALDITSIVFRPFDEYWNEMVANSATFWGYMYRLNGMHWGNTEVTVVWFLMSRREGLFTSAVRNQLIGMGDWKAAQGMPHGYHNPYFAMGDQTLLPLVTMFNYSTPRCKDDKTVGPPVAWPEMCPELEWERFTNEMPGPPRNDAKLMWREPRDGPQLPFAFLQDFSMGLWQINGTKSVNSGIPPRCDTEKECWETVFMERLHRQPPSGETRVMNFIKMFGSAGKLKDMSRQELLADHNAYLYNWLKLAGLKL